LKIFDNPVITVLLFTFAFIFLPFALLYIILVLRNFLGVYYEKAF